MSVIVVVSDGTRCCMACDSQASGGSAKSQLALPKFVKIAGALVGTDGTHATANYLRYYRPVLSSWPLATNTTDVAVAITDGLRPWLKERGLMERASNNAEELPSGLLVALRSQFVLVDAGGSVVEFADPFFAIGSGRCEARGAMLIASRFEHATADQIAWAGVEAACRFDDGCSLPMFNDWTEP